MDIRKRIIDELAKQGRSRYWLGMEVAKSGAANRETVFRYLRGARDTSGTVIGAMLAVLKVDLTSLAAGRMAAEPIVTSPIRGKAKRAKGKARAVRAR
jgi:hypothetical protein